jgi:integrase
VNREAKTIFLGRSKNGESRLLPLVGELEQIIARRHQARTTETSDGGTRLAKFVFHCGDGTIVGDFRKAWATARSKVGLSGLLFHDLRRSAVRNFDRSGVTQIVGMMISGHKTPSVYKRYRIVPEKDIREALAQVQKANEREGEAVRVVSMTAGGAK